MTDWTCAACARGEQVVRPPHSSTVGSLPVHAPSGAVCTESPEFKKKLEGQTDPVVRAIRKHLGLPEIP